MIDSGQLTWSEVNYHKYEGGENSTCLNIEGLQFEAMKMIMSFIVVSAFLFTPFAMGENKICPIMVDDEVDEEEVVEFEGKKVLMCCGGCIKAWDKNPKYYIKASAALLPQFKGMEKELGLDKVKLMEQKFCPIYNDRVVAPESPVIEYKGKKIHVYSKGAIRRWNRDPDAAFAKAVAAGVLPQFEDNKKVEGMTNPVEKK